MLNDFTGADKVYIACGYTDLRKGWSGHDGTATILTGPIHQYAVSVLWAKAGSNKGAVLGTGWLYPPLQKAGAGGVPVAEVRS